MTMIERVASAIHGYGYDELDENLKRVYRRKARAAIQAIREPDEKMLQAAADTREMKDVSSACVLAQIHSSPTSSPKPTRKCPMPDKIARRYGCWGGNPDGDPEDPRRCIAAVHEGGRILNIHQCLRPRGHGPDGLYCRQHAPDAVKARSEAASARRDRNA